MKGSKEDEDMDMSKQKKFHLHVQKQDPVTATTSTEAADKCKFTCLHLNCGFKFMTSAGLRVHMGRCPWKDEFEVERIVGHRPRSRGGQTI